MKILFATSEAYPYIKTGGLADVSGSLPQALAGLNHDVKLILPAYLAIFNRVREVKVITEFIIGGAGRSLWVKLLEVVSPEPDGISVWLVDIPQLFNREGGPYSSDDGESWWDNGERFAAFSRAVAQISMNQVGINWKADVVHANDWQTGLVPAFLSEEEFAPRTVFTIHNMAYAGYFPKSLFDSMWMPWHWWTPQGVEFYGQLSMLKAGLMFSNWVNTVSPTYAEEITTPEFGYGFDGVLRQVKQEGRLSGILNGIDTSYWNPEIDEYLVANYSATKNLEQGKKANKKALLERFKASSSDADLKIPLVGFVGRLVDQKGVDLILEALPELLAESRVKFVFVGSGDPYYEDALRDLARRYPQQVFTHIGYSEPLAHQVEAGSDVFLMPSRFEPCGLNQMYSLAYGTLPLVNNTGGLSDTVINATAKNISNKTATGFVFYEATADALRETIEYAIELYADKKVWKQTQVSAMSQEFNWQKSAQKYLELYLRRIE